MKKPAALKVGDKVGIIAPGAIFNREKFKTGIAVLKSWGLVPVYDKNLFKKDFIFAGTVEQRLAGLKSFLGRRDIKAIWCVRGGYGAYAVAEKLAKAKIKTGKVMVLGLSDITSLHLVFNQKFKIPTLHAPMIDRMGNQEQTPLERNSLKKTLFDPAFRLQVSSGLRSLGKNTVARGELVGGNLALLCSSIGTPWEVQTAGKVLFFEDIGEPAYRVDRMISQLKQAGKLDKVKAVVIGDFTECRDKDGVERWREVLGRHFSKAKYPVLLGVHSGHGKLRLPLPLGLRVEVKTSGKKQFRVLESYAK